jgi:hypothetical protein
MEYTEAIGPNRDPLKIFTLVQEGKRGPKRCSQEFGRSRSYPS